MRRCIVTGMILATVLLSLAATLEAAHPASRDLVLLDPPRISPPGPVARASELDEFVYLFHMLGNAEYYLGSGGLNDTICVVYTPEAACSVITAEAQWHTNPGTIETFVWRYNEACDSLYPGGIAPFRGASPVSPIGDLLFGPFATESPGAGIGVYIPLFTLEDQGENPVTLEAGESFVVGYVKTGEGTAPSILADDVSSISFSHTWFGGPWTDGLWGGYSSGPTIIEAVVRVGVEYYDPDNGPIRKMTRLSNTIDGQKRCTVHAQLLDDNGWTTDNGELLVSINGGEPDTYPMTGPEPDSTFTGTFTLDCQVGDEITYWIEVTDDEGNLITNADQAWSFYVVTLDTTADFLAVLADRTSPRGQVITRYLDGAGIHLVYWDPVVNKGIDASVVNQDWEAVLLFNPVMGQLPLREYGEDAYSAYLEGNGDLLIASSNLIVPEGGNHHLTFQPGDFAFDFLGIRDAFAHDEIADSVFMGNEGCSLTRAFNPYPLVTSPSLIQANNVSDRMNSLSTARTIFTGFEQGYGYGIQVYWGDAKRVTLSFDIASACEQIGEDNQGNPVLCGTEQFDMLMDNILYWMLLGVDEPPVAAPAKFQLGSAHPNPFNAATRIEFTLPRAQRVTVSVHDILGRCVATLLEGTGRPGTQNLVWRPGNDVASGVYFLRVKTAERIATKKLVLLK